MFLLGAASFQGIPSSRRILYISVLSEAFLNIRWRVQYLQWGIFRPRPTLQSTEPHPFGCPRLLIKYNGSYPPCLEAVSSMCNLRTRHAVVTSDPLNMAFTFHGVNIGVRNEINNNMGIIEHFNRLVQKWIYVTYITHLSSLLTICL
jgi:hypothetical protein